MSRHHELVLIKYLKATSAIGSGIQRKIHSSGTTTLIILNEEMNHIMEIVEALKDSNVLLERVTKTIKNETKKPKGGFSGILFGTLGAILLGSILAKKGIVRAGSGNKVGIGILRAAYGNEINFLKLFTRAVTLK